MLNGTNYIYWAFIKRLFENIKRFLRNSLYKIISKNANTSHGFPQNFGAVQCKSRFTQKPIMTSLYFQLYHSAFLAVHTSYKKKHSDLFFHGPLILHSTFVKANIEFPQKNYTTKFYSIYTHARIICPHPQAIFFAQRTSFRACFLFSNCFVRPTTERGLQPFPLLRANYSFQPQKRWGGESNFDSRYKFSFKLFRLRALSYDRAHVPFWKRGRFIRGTWFSRRRRVYI